MNLARLAQLVDGHGEPVNGCDLPPDDAQAMAHTRFPNLSTCLVRDWTILDLETTSDEMEALRDRGLEPVMVYALNVVFDSRGRFNAGDWVRSSFQLSFEDNGFFLTKNTLYVLLGKGARQRITVSDLTSLQ